jgi:LuxR family maltose regulon positive regulatory protein
MASIAKALSWVDDRSLLAEAIATDFEIVLTEMINRLDAQEQGVVVVLDDYHYIRAPAIHAAVTFLLEHMPGHVTLVIASRADPPLPLARLRAREQLIELHAADLRFTLSEIQAYCEIRDLPLAPSEIQVLDDTLEGWPAGIQLTTLALRRAARQQAQSADAPALLNERRLTCLDCCYQHLFAYLAEDVFGKLPAHLKAFLLQTAVLDDMSGPLCDAVLGFSSCDGRDCGLSQSMDSHSRLILHELEQANLFVVPLDSNHFWYRYHHLFHAFLRERLAYELPAVVSELHLRASRWYEGNGYVSQAIEHALAAQVYDRALDLIEASARGVVEQGGYEALQNWLAQIPEQQLYLRPAMCLWSAWVALFMGDVERIEPMLKHAVDIWSAAGNRAKLGEVAHLQAHLARLRNDPEQTIYSARQALLYLPEEELTLRAGSMLALGAGQLLAGAIAEAEAILLEAAAQCRMHNYLGLLVAWRYLGDLAARRGQLQAAEEWYQKTVQALGNRELWERWSIEIALGDLARERNDLAKAETCLRAALIGAQRIGVAHYAVPGYIGLARTLMARGAFVEAESLLREAVHAAMRLGSSAYTRQIAAYQAQLAVLQGDAVAAQDWYAERSKQLEREASGMCESEIVTLARLLIAQRHSISAHEALPALHATLKRLERNARSHADVRSQIEALMLRALVEMATGRRSDALQTIRQALVLAAPSGYVRLFLDAGEPMQALLALCRLHLIQQERGRKDQAQMILHASLDTLLYAFDIAIAPAGSSPVEGCEHQLIEMLSEREVDVLRRVAEGATNQAIAEDLVISIGTVKSHINHILGKLAAHNRTEAVARAREYGLLIN